jgi:hypothetical protein
VFLSTSGESWHMPPPAIVQRAAGIWPCAMRAAQSRIARAHSPLPCLWISLAADRNTAKFSTLRHVA